MSVPIQAQSVKNEISLFFKFNEIVPDKEQQEKGVSFIENSREGGRRFILIQGFACNLGGFEHSIAIANKRAESLNEILQNNIAPAVESVIADGIVVYLMPREPHRRVVIRAFASRDEMMEYLKRANLLAGEMNREETRHRHRELLHEGGYNVPIPEREDKYSINFNTVIVILILLLIGLVASMYYFRQRAERLSDHTLSEVEAEALSALTSFEVQPLGVAEERIYEKETGEKEPAGRMAGKRKRAGKDIPTAAKSILLRRSEVKMATKKKPKSNPISIQGALDRQYEELTLKGLMKSPVSALDGLTPRHARLLEEGFGVKTIEDLARLKYFEIAKAIVVLAKYEK